MKQIPWTFTFYFDNGDSKSVTGYTPLPEKGVDYNTPADQESIVQQVIAAQGMPDYVKTEAEDVLARVIAAQGKRTFTFAAISDMHYGNSSYTDGVDHACQAMAYIDSRLKLDAVAVLGDYTDGYPATGYANAVEDLRAVNAVLNGLRFGPNLRTQGNHDYYAEHAAETRRYIQAYSDDVVWGSRIGGYYYKDFADFKLRVIVPNTTETDNANIGCSAEQYAWFAQSLDLSAKSDAAEWQILVLSHHPVDWYYADSSYSLAYIMNAYKEGTSYSNSYVSCNFSGKNAATLIGNIHGHIHNLLTDNVYLGNTASGNKSNVYRMATPEACIDRANQYTGAWAESTTYGKTKNTAQDTSFVVYCIDLETNTIKAVCYGAGYDRELVYAGSGAGSGYTNLIDTVGYEDGKRLSGSSGTTKDQTGCVTTGFIPIAAVGDVYRTSGVDFNEAGSAGNSGWCYCGVYDGNKNTLGINSITTSTTHAANISIVCDANGNATITVNDNATLPGYIRLSGVGSGANLIVTKNEEIK